MLFLSRNKIDFVPSTVAPYSEIVSSEKEKFFPIHVSSPEAVRKSDFPLSFLGVAQGSCSLLF
jgi:hypothetical protein